MNTDLQAKLARRRRLAEGKQEEGKPPAPSAPPPPSSSKDNLQEIMARRRRLADGSPDDSNEMSLEDLKQTTREAPSRNSSLQGSGSFEYGAHSSKGDNLQAIMERRRRLADGEDVSELQSPAHSPRQAPKAALSGSSSSGFPISPMQTLPAQRRGSSGPLAYIPQGVSSPGRGISRNTSNDKSALAPGERPSAVASPVKQDLKGISMSQDLKVIMDRRRKLASGGDMDDEDPPMAVPDNNEDEDPPMAVPDAPSLAEGDATHTKQVNPQKTLENASNHSTPELDITSTHTHLNQANVSIHEKDPLLDVDDSGDDSSDEIKLKVPVVEERASKTSSAQSTRSGRDRAGALGHGSGGHERQSQRGRSSQSSRHKKTLSKDERQSSSFLGDDDSDTEQDDTEAKIIKKPPPIDTSMSETPKAAEKQHALFDDDDDDEGDSSSDGDDTPGLTPLDSPAVAVMGSSTAETEDAEVEMFAAALEQEPASAPDEEEQKDKPQRRKTTESNASEAGDTVPDLPEKRLRDKLPGGRRKPNQSAEEASVDPSVDSKNSAGSGGNGSATGSSNRRPRNRRAADGVKRGSTSGERNRRRSTASGASAGAVNDDRRRKPTKGRRSNDRSKSDDSKSSTEGRPDRGGRRRNGDDMSNQEADDATRASQDSGEDLGAPPSSALEMTSASKTEEATSKNSDPFGGGWGGFGAFGETGAADSSALPKESEHSALPSDENRPRSAATKSGGGAFGRGDAFPTGNGFGGSEGSSDAFASMDAGGFPSSGDGFSGAFMAGFGDSAAFPGTSNGEAKVDFSNNAFGGDGGGGFSDAFGAFEGGNTFAVSGPDAFDQVNFSATPKREEVIYESSPLSGVPTRTQPVPAVYQKTVLKGPFQGSLSTNALNGNLIVCSETGDGVVLREIDPLRHYQQASAASIFSPELQRKVAAKFNLTAHSVESVIRLSSGLHHEQGQTRLRVGAILDVRVLEAPQPLRLVAVWLWGQGVKHPVSIQYALSPPSGGDFTYDETTLVMADNLIFLAGTSPKGPCIFVSKPAVRESWTANSLPGSGKVSAMEVTPHADRTQPHLAIGLTDRSVSIWTYREAVEGAATKGKESGPKRWLFPLCRLESTKTLSGIDATSLNPTGTPTGQGKQESTVRCTLCVTQSPSPNQK